MRTVVPPQILIQMLYGEAHGQAVIGDTTSQLAIGVAAYNRFAQPAYFSATTWQVAINLQQFNGTNYSITNGPQPDLEDAGMVFADVSGVSVGSAGCFFSPTSSGWTAISAALASGTSTLPSVQYDPGCYPSGRQFLVKTSVGKNANGSGAPAFIFEQLRTNPSAAAVISIP